jgi:hypothetical protein
MEAEKSTRGTEEAVKGNILEDEDFIRQELKKASMEKANERESINKRKEDRRKIKESPNSGKTIPEEKLSDDRKERFFHQNSEEHAVKRSYSAMLSIVFVSIVSTFTVMIIYLRNYLQKFFDKYLLSSLKILIRFLV